MRRLRRRPLRVRRLYESSLDTAVKFAIKRSEFPKVAKYLNKVIDFADYIQELIDTDEYDDFYGYDVDNLVSYGNSAAKIVSKFSREADIVAAELNMYDDEDDDWTIARTLLSMVADDVINTALRELGY